MAPSFRWDEGMQGFRMNSAGINNDNFSQAELDKFGALANRWWDPQGPQKALHALNPARLGYVAERTTLRGAAVLDVGCGGGLLSETLAGAGASVTAIDLAPELIKIAKLHRLESKVEVDYRLSSVEALATTTRSPAWKCSSTCPIPHPSCPPAPAC